jgi:large subunit ribosomal protein L22
MKCLEYNKETMSKSVGRSMPISTRHAIEICNFIRGKNIQKVKSYLQEVTKQKKAIPFTRFNKGVGHKPGIGPGRFPVKACGEILMLIESAESNALFKGLNTANLVIGSIIANKSAVTWHYGRQRRRKMKRTNLDIILIEKASKIDNKNKKEKVQEKKETPKSKIEESKKENNQEIQKKTDNQKVEKKDIKSKDKKTNEGTNKK